MGEARRKKKLRAKGLLPSAEQERRQKQMKLFRAFGSACLASLRDFVSKRENDRTLISFYMSRMILFGNAMARLTRIREFCDECGDDIVSLGGITDLPARLYHIADATKNMFTMRSPWFLQPNLDNLKEDCEALMIGALLGDYAVAFPRNEGGAPRLHTTTLFGAFPSETELSDFKVPPPEHERIVSVALVYQMLGWMWITRSEDHRRLAQAMEAALTYDTRVSFTTLRQRSLWFDAGFSVSPATMKKKGFWFVDNLDPNGSQWASHSPDNTELVLDEIERQQRNNGYVQLYRGTRQPFNVPIRSGGTRRNNPQSSTLFGSHFSWTLDREVAVGFARHKETAGLAIDGVKNFVRTHYSVPPHKAALLMGKTRFEQVMNEFAFLPYVLTTRVQAQSLLVATAGLRSGTGTEREVLVSPAVVNSAGFTYRKVERHAGWKEFPVAWQEAFAQYLRSDEAVAGRRRRNGGIRVAPSQTTE